MESSGTCPAVASCAPTERSLRTFSLSLLNMDASPSRAPTASTYEGTRAEPSWVTARLSMHPLSGSTDSSQSVFLQQWGRSTSWEFQPPLQSAGMKLDCGAGSNFHACFYTSCQVAIDIFLFRCVFFFFLRKWNGFNNLIGKMYDCCNG